MAPVILVREFDVARRVPAGTLSSGRHRHVGRGRAAQGLSGTHIRSPWTGSVMGGEEVGGRTLQTGMGASSMPWWILGWCAFAPAACISPRASWRISGPSRRCPRRSALPCPCLPRQRSRPDPRQAGDSTHPVTFAEGPSAGRMRLVERVDVAPDADRAVAGAGRPPVIRDRVRPDAPRDRCGGRWIRPRLSCADRGAVTWLTVRV